MLNKPNIRNIRNTRNSILLLEQALLGFADGRRLQVQQQRLFQLLLADQVTVRLRRGLRRYRVTSGRRRGYVRQQLLLQQGRVGQRCDR